MASGGSFITLAKGNRSRVVTNACKKHGGFYLGSIGGPAAILAQNCIKKARFGGGGMWSAIAGHPVAVAGRPAGGVKDAAARHVVLLVRRSRCSSIPSSGWRPCGERWTCVEPGWGRRVACCGPGLRRWPAVLLFAWRRKIDVQDFPAFIVVDDKGNDFFAVSACAGCGQRGGECTQRCHADVFCLPVYPCAGVASVKERRAQIGAPRWCARPPASKATASCVTWSGLSCKSGVQKRDLRNADARPHPAVTCAACAAARR